VASRHPPAAASQPAAVTAVVDLTKDYSPAARKVHALRAISLQVQKGEFIATMRPSDSGKSTFMNFIGCLDRSTSGSYQLDGVEITDQRPTELANLRNRKIGFIFQGFNLLARGRRALESVALGDHVHHRSNELSGGQPQRVAIARSLVNAPTLILADEPTGNLDSRTSEEILAILQRLNQGGATIVLVTHAPDIATYCSRTVVFKDGVIVSVQSNRYAGSAANAVAQRPINLEEAA